LLIAPKLRDDGWARWTAETRLEAADTRAIAVDNPSYLKGILVVGTPQGGRG
jgi:hypothetical protein